jgi:hypothetical protein
MRRKSAIPKLVQVEIYRKGGFGMRPGGGRRLITFTFTDGNGGWAKVPSDDKCAGEIGRAAFGDQGWALKPGTLNQNPVVLEARDATLAV